MAEFLLVLARGRTIATGGRGVFWRGYGKTICAGSPEETLGAVGAGGGDMAGILFFKQG